MKGERMPTEDIKLRTDADTYNLLKEMAAAGGNSLNKLVNELIKQALTQEAREGKETNAILNKILESNPRRLDEKLEVIEERIKRDSADKELTNVILLSIYALVRGLAWSNSSLEKVEKVKKVIKYVEENIEKANLDGQTIYEILGIEKTEKQTGGKEK